MFAESRSEENSGENGNHGGTTKYVIKNDRN